MRGVTLALLILATPPLALAKPASKTAKAPAAMRGVWRSLVKPGAHWTLRGTSDATATVEVSTYDLRTLDGAEVVRLRWLLKSKLTKPAGDAYDPSYAPTQIAVTDRGAYFLLASDKDDDVRKALKRAPDYADPPEPVTSSHTSSNRDVRYTKTGDTAMICVGRGPSKSDGACESVCEGHMCLAPDRGIVSIDGLWSAGGDDFAQAAPVGEK